MKATGRPVPSAAMLSAITRSAICSAVMSGWWISTCIGFASADLAVFGGGGAGGGVSCWPKRRIIVLASPMAKFCTVSIFDRIVAA